MMPSAWLDVDRFHPSPLIDGVIVAPAAPFSYSPGAVAGFPISRPFISVSALNEESKVTVDVTISLSLL